MYFQFAHVLSIPKFRSYYLLLYALFFTQTIYTQKTKAIISRPHILEGKDVIIVRFKIYNCKPYERFDLGLKFYGINRADMNNLNKPLPEDTIYARTISGDINYISGEKLFEGAIEKTIIWHVKNDVSQLPEEICAQVYIKSYTFVTGGAINAWRSIIPGQGINFVKDKNEVKFKPWQRQIIFAGFAGYSIYEKINFTLLHNKYINAEKQFDIENYYKKATNSNKRFILATAATLGLWIADIGTNAIIGLRNTKKEKRKNQNLGFYVVPENFGVCYSCWF